MNLTCNTLASQATYLIPAADPHMLPHLLFINRRIPLPTRLVRAILLTSLLVSGCHQPSLPDVAISDTDSQESSRGAEPTVDLIDHAINAMAQGRFEIADHALKQCLLADPHHPKALELSADLANHRGNAGAAAVLYQSAIDEYGATADRQLFDKWSKSLIRAGRPYEAIEALQTLSERFPTDAQSRYELAGLAAAFGMPEAAVPALRWLVQRGQSDPESLLVLADPVRVEPDVDSCKKVLAISGEDRRAEFGLARFDALHQDWTAVAARLKPIVQRFPQFVPAYALYGQSLAELGEDAKLAEWQESAPKSADNSPQYWMVLGRWEQTRGHHEAAAKAFWESLRRGGAIYPEALTYLLVSIHQLQRTDDATRLTHLIVKHTELRDALKIHLERRDQSQAACMRVAEAMLALGRVWEAEGWARVAVSLPQEKLPDLRERYMSIRNQLEQQSPWQLPEMMAASQVDLSDLSGTTAGDSPQLLDAPASTAKGQIAFSDQARQRNWIHISLPAPEVGGHSIEQSVGGGIAVIDFDCDGWPDLAAAALDGTALQNDSSPNRLSRNLNGSFADVSAAAGYRDTGFSQGLTVADYNDDGFPDLFDANIGRNRLYRNNGDGTFTDVSDSAGLAGEQWTTSVAMVDLDGDSILDIYEANYCAGRAPFERECRNKFGLGTCSPLIFNAEPDRVWRGHGDGTFTETTDDWMTQTSPGRGLGLVAGELDERPGVDVLVANDMTVNHLWSSQPKSLQPSRGAFQLTDLGVVRGLGTSGKSHSQASMGIAAADADGDGDLDLFMTHFSDDYNTYYEQVAPGFWSDRSYQMGFSEPSMKLLGFGTQWADFDNGGGLELVIANGHVDRVDRDDVAYRMPPQLFSRTENGRWEEWDRSALGEYFSHDHLGRAMVTLDVDRDGRCDVAISHVDDPAALLVNQTPDAGRSIRLELKATQSPRDAIGARVTAMIGTRKHVSQLMTGDGYMASNERQIHIGCGQAETIEEVTVSWPSGHVESFGVLASGRDYLLVEGSAKSLTTWQHPQR
ncbi:FG-GAP-like repeat-containing protein [Novipirellula sp.]|uniref:FG-GAP-like repeat-containing protein n=1 Tax=Novipirellula sp. TaxID=2795430 RepID=UPI003567E2CF